jgi:LysR family transcriptional activator of nhaA
MTYLNYHHLRYFSSIAREGSITRAAQKHNISASSLSIQLKLLEDQLGHKLFERTGRTLKLTEAGKIAYSYARSLFRLGDEFIGTLDTLANPSRHVLRVGVVSGLSRNFQIELLRPLIGKDGIDLIINYSSFSDLLSGLNNHIFDLLLTNQPSYSEHGPDLQCIMVSDQPVSLIGSPKLLKRKICLPEDLESIPLALPPRGNNIRNAFDETFNTQNIRLNISAEVDDMAMLRLIARENKSFILAPPVVVLDELSNKSLKEYFTFKNIRESFYAIIQHRKFMNPLLKQLNLERFSAAKREH